MQDPSTSRTSRDRTKYAADKNVSGTIYFFLGINVLHYINDIILEAKQIYK